MMSRKICVNACVQAYVCLCVKSNFSDNINGSYHQAFVSVRIQTERRIPSQVFQQREFDIRNGLNTEIGTARSILLPRSEQVGFHNFAHTLLEMPFTAHFSITRIHLSFKDTRGNNPQSLYNLSMCVWCWLGYMYVCVCACVYVCVYARVHACVCVCPPPDSSSPALKPLLALISPSFPISFLH